MSCQISENSSIIFLKNICLSLIILILTTHVNQRFHDFGHGLSVLNFPATIKNISYEKSLLIIQNQL